MPQADAKLTISRAEFHELQNRARSEIAEAIERHLAAADRLITQLDEMDGNFDDEDDGTGEDPEDLEPSLGAAAGVNQERAWRRHPVELQFGDNLDLEDDDADREPSLGALNPSWPSTIEGTAPSALNRYLDQERWWAHGNGADLEEQHDGAEPEPEDRLSWIAGGGSETN